MELTFPISINGGDAEVTIEVTKKEYNKVTKSDEWYLRDVDVSLYNRVVETFREQQEEFGIDIDDFDFAVLLPSE